jgi:hypothetical protein
MAVVMITLSVIAAAGLLAGATFGTFMAAAFGAALAAWQIRLAPARASRLSATLDPEAPDSAVLLEAFQEAVRLIRRTDRAVLLRISAFRAAAQSALQLDLTRDGDLAVTNAGQRTRHLKQPGVWIADHPLPLELPRSRCLTLRLAPVSGGRISVSRPSALPLSVGAWAAVVLLAAAACASGAALLLAALPGFAFQRGLLDDHDRRSSRQP